MTRTTDLQRGMTVYSRDGVYLGEIKEVWAETTSHGHLPISQYLLADYGPVQGTAGLLNTSQGHLHVQQGSLFAADRQDLYFSISDVHAVNMNESITVRVPEAHCRTQYSQVPESLNPAA